MKPSPFFTIWTKTLMKSLKVKITVFSLLAFSPLFVKAQQAGGISRDYGTRVSNTQFATSGSEAALSELWAKGLGKPNVLVNEDQIKGSPYLNSEFKKGKVYFNDELVGTFFLRYNAYQDEIQISKTPQRSEPFQALVKAGNVSCTLEGNEMVYTHFVSKGGEIQQGYLIKLNNGENYKLLARKSKKFMEGKKSGNSIARDIEPRFVEEVEYYFWDNTSPHKTFLPSGKDKLIKLFAVEHQGTLKGFIKKKGLKLSVEDHLISIFSIANGL